VRSYSASDLSRRTGMILAGCRNAGHGMGKGLGRRAGLDKIAGTSFIPNRTKERHINWGCSLMIHGAGQLGWGGGRRLCSFTLKRCTGKMARVHPPPSGFLRASLELSPELFLCRFPHSRALAQRFTRFSDYIALTFAGSRQITNCWGREIKKRTLSLMASLNELALDFPLPLSAAELNFSWALHGMHWFYKGKFALF
jgi:hypothetical protein